LQHHSPERYDSVCIAGVALPTFTALLTVLAKLAMTPHSGLKMDLPSVPTAVSNAQMEEAWGSTG